MMSGPGSEEARGDARSGGVRVSRFCRGRVGADERHLTGDGCHGGLMTSAAAAKVVRRAALLLWILLQQGRWLSS